MSQDPTAICPGCCQRVAACMCRPSAEVARRVGPARFDRVTRGPDGKFCHWFRGEPVNDPNPQPEQRPHDWPYCHPEGLAVVAHGHPVDGVGAAVIASDALVALADLERAARAGPANPDQVRELVAKVRAELLK